MTALIVLGVSNLIALGLYQRQRQEVQRLRRMFRITLNSETRVTR